MRGENSTKNQANLNLEVKFLSNLSRKDTPQRVKTTLRRSEY